jgi:hypothetical protein
MDAERMKVPSVKVLSRYELTAFESPFFSSFDMLFGVVYSKYLNIIN